MNDQKLVLSRAQLRRDFAVVCDYFGFDPEYRKLIWSWIGHNEKAMACYRAIAYSLSLEAK
jgi:hypothetical protein